MLKSQQMNKYLITTLNVLIALTSFSQPSATKTIIGVFAHPDDENMVGSVLAKYAREGSKVYVIIATDGKYGTRVTKIPEGDSLATIRQQESICACKKLAIEPPIFLSLDRLDTKNGVRSYLNNHKKFLTELKTYIDSLKPDLLITFGPDGEYGHSEHIVVGASVTELLLREGWVEKYPLYFLAWKKEQVTDDEDLSYVADKYINVEITYSDEDEQKYFEAFACFTSQFTSEEIKESIDKQKIDKTNKVPFRKFYLPPKQKIKKSF
jgi:LmbE family N-acetylglucosaminyl deacetylase